MARPTGAISGLITRFAPSPTGPLHLGHAYSALLIHDMAQVAGGTVLLRIEDIDSTRCKPEHEAGILTDLTWLGCMWTTMRRQSDHAADYWGVLKGLARKNLIFPCDCTRKLILDTGAEQGPDGPIYPGTCQHKSMDEAKPSDAIRLNIKAALRHLPNHITRQNPVATIGAPILRRKDTGDPAYHLACTHDDALQGVTHVIRGQDVDPLTPIHLILQHLMDWPTPIYHHHKLITDSTGKRLAKIDKSRALAKFRADGATPNDIREIVGLPTSPVE